MPSGDCLRLARPVLGVHQERSCLHVVASSMRDRCVIDAPTIPRPTHRTVAKKDGHNIRPEALCASVVNPFAPFAPFAPLR